MALVLILLLVGAGLFVAPALRAPNFITPATVLSEIKRIDTATFGGWFSREGRNVRTVLAIVKVESSFNANAVGDLFTADRSWGLGQVRLTTANDFGSFPSGDLLLDPTTNLTVMMAFLKWSWEFLERRLGRPPTHTEWLGSYNAGVGNVIDRGFIPLAYVQRVRAAERALA